MVEAPNARLDVKLSLDLSAQNKSPVVKRVLASDYTTLMNQAKALGTKHGLSEADCQLRYHDGDNWVIVEDNQDLELAFAIATSSTMKLIFSIKPAGVSASQVSTSATVPADEEMKEESQQIGHKKGRKDHVKGIPRKALKNLINNELEKQSHEVFKKLLQSDDLPPVEQTAEQAAVVHTNVSCDGCGINPIRGLRYKCSVCKNFDYCAQCEERLGHEHAFLKICEDGGAPDVMITMLDE